MKHVFSISLLLFSLLLIACEEDVEGGLNAPVLEVTSVQSDRFYFTATIKEDGANGKVYYIVETSDKPFPTAQEIKSKPYVNILEVQGREFIKPNMSSLASKTNYTLYAFIGVNDQMSKVASAHFTTE